MLEALQKFKKLPITAKLPRDREWVYFLATQRFVSLVKIGSSRVLRRRVLGVQTSCPIPLKLIGVVSAPAGTEFVIHAKFSKDRYGGEWFFLSDELSAFIASLPKGGSLPLGMAEQWAAEVKVNLLHPVSQKDRDHARRSGRLMHGHLQNALLEYT